MSEGGVATGFKTFPCMKSFEGGMRPRPRVGEKKFAQMLSAFPLPSSPPFLSQFLSLVKFIIYIIYANNERGKRIFL